jgi:hypothetical protein
MDDRRTTIEIDLDSVIDRLVEGACVSHVGGPTTDRRARDWRGTAVTSYRPSYAMVEQNA